MPPSSKWYILCRRLFWWKDVFSTVSCDWAWGSQGDRCPQPPNDSYCVDIRNALTKRCVFHSFVRLGEGSWKIFLFFPLCNFLCNCK